MRAFESARTPRWFLVVLAATVVLWVIVAGLQYKVARELSSVTQVRMGGTLQSVMTQWHRDLYDELSTVCIALQVGPDSGAHDGWNDYLQRYATWTQDADAPHLETDLVKAVYVWDTSGPGDPQLLRADPAEQSLDPVSVPPELARLLTRLNDRSSDLPIALRAWESGPPETVPNAKAGSASLSRSNPLAGWQLDDRGLALVHPILHHADPFNSQTPVVRTRVDWLVVVLNMEVLQTRILPELANRYFGGAGGLEYRLAVIDTDSDPRVIYSSDPHLRIAEVMNFDSIMNIFNSSPDTMKSQFWQRLKNNANLQEETWRNFSAPGWFPVFQYGRGTADDPWVLVLQHRTQPVSGIAETLWRRNLLTGGLALVLLGTNIAVILLATRRAQKLATAQAEFVASTSHELLTPLAAIYCSGQNAKDGLLRTPEDLIAHGSIVTTQTRQLIDMVRQNLLFASTSSGAHRFTLRRLKVSEVLERVEHNVAILREPGACAVRFHAPPDLPTVTGDLSALTQCLQNLVSNAIKYSDKGGEVVVSASLCEGQDREREINISVADQGRGMDAGELRNIFKPFYRSPKVVDAEIHGTGLGLTVAARIAEALGGKLTVESELGVGSTFTLHLPVEKSEREIPVDASEMNLGAKT